MTLVVAPYAAADFCPPDAEIVHGLATLDPTRLGTFDEICVDGCPAMWCATRTADGTLVRNGPFLSWRGDWTPNAEGFYRDDKRDGPWRGWYADGRRRYEGGWTADAKSGSWTFWHPDGSVAELGDFLDDEYDGFWVRWWPNGQRHSEGRSARGTPIGIWRYRTAEGALLGEGTITLSVIVD
jgi:hypothetical protein